MEAPVGEFIEQRYRKRLGGHPHDQDSRGPEQRTRKPSIGVVATNVDADVSERVRLADAPGADDYTQDPELEWTRDG
ncbi:MAG: hypothetical protein A3F70_10710 [Acidobacteria bacterium RIFCSPLOWO2_12_FULL_67_14]|nr:MAG: hypothetical protein A3H29_09635 [Acidobacteria bacterium RIFCSPLOWO2_02_FULL_67_21]OFW35171.1 MAG: hypothetical protein A3F70_10710 [Acidobacteria bacterium RIFCSPLOWO2_12_FULL_67_14]